MGILIHVGGMDATGKSTLCEKLSKEFNAEITHFSNPKDMQDGKNQYFNFLNNIDKNKNYVCDRFHDGEWVYAPIYRGYIANYMSEIEDNIIENNNYLFAFTTAQLQTILDRIAVRGEDFVKPEHYQTVMDNFVNNYLMEQRMPFTIADTTNMGIEETFEYVKEDARNLNLIWNQFRQCTKCNTTLKPLALPRGNIRAKYMVVGQNPGGKGKGNEHFIKMFGHGKTSEFLIDVLKKAGIYLDCWFTNVVLCSTENNKITSEQKYECLDNLQLQIEIIKPEKIFALGKEASNTIKENFPNIEVIEVPHPTYMTRFYSSNKSKMDEYINMFK